MAREPLDLSYAPKGAKRVKRNDEYRYEYINATAGWLVLAYLTREDGDRLQSPMSRLGPFGTRNTAERFRFDGRNWELTA